MVIDLRRFLLPGWCGHTFTHLSLLLSIQDGNNGAHRAQMRSQICCARDFSSAELALPDPQFGAEFLREILQGGVCSL